jgi:hypothetical protein
MLFKRTSPRKTSAVDGNLSLPLLTPRGTARRPTPPSLSSFLSPSRDDLKQTAVALTFVLMLVLLSVVATSMVAQGSGSVSLWPSTTASGRVLKREMDPELFPWKTMKRPAKNISSSRRHLPTFSTRTTTTVTHSLAKETASKFNDPSPFYNTLRTSYETFFPPNHRRRSLNVVEQLQQYQLKTHPIPSYDIHSCPDVPPEGYPFQWNLVGDILAQWPADDMDPPASATIYQGLCVFDFEKDYDKAFRYRNEELPFIVRGDPAVAQTVERWNTPYYLQALLGDVKQGAEYSSTSDFLYWTNANVHHQADWQPPTQHLEMTYSEWMEKANLTDDRLLQPGMPHYYFKVVGCAAGRSSHSSLSSSSSLLPMMPCSILAGGEHVPYLTDEMPFYTQTRSSLYIKETVDGTQSKAINCRFGMKGVKATNHFDGERNFITVFQGVRRMILAHPNQCSKLALFPPGHPSARHSQVDWSHPDLTLFPEFDEALANEVVLQPGDSLFLPSLWFHFIVSMSLNIQCNTRSGMDSKHVADIDACGWA